MPATGSVRAVAFESTETPGVAFATCDHTDDDGAPGIMRTADYGQTWSVVATATMPFASISFAPAPGQNVGWAAGSLGILYKTSDGGETWVPQSSNSPGSASLSAVFALSQDSAYAVGEHGVVVQTADGTTWNAENSGWGSDGSSGSFRGLAFTDPEHGFAVGDYGTIMRTSMQAPPHTSATLEPAAPDGMSGWYVTPPAVTLTSDQQAQTYYSWDSTSTWAPYTGAVVADEGVHSLRYYSQNSANRQEAVESLTVKTTPSRPARRPA